VNASFLLEIQKEAINDKQKFQRLSPSIIETEEVITKFHLSGCFDLKTSENEPPRSTSRDLNHFLNSFFSKSGPASHRSIAKGAMLRSPTTNTLLP
jgi:hypothetical protein